MKKIITMAVLIFSSMLTYACTGGAEQKQAETQKTAQEGSVIVMNKAMFIKDIFDYEKSKVNKILFYSWLPLRFSNATQKFRSRIKMNNITPVAISASL